MIMKKRGTFLLEVILLLKMRLSVSALVGLEESITNDCVYLFGESRHYIGTTRTILELRAAIYIYMGTDPVLF